jgi:aspartyl-tRNA(Asn)/glutamyl-tRNA(Gln) amidotransferase subunit A
MIDPKRTIREIHDSFDRKEYSATELTRSYLAACKASDHNAWLTLCEERALGQAAAADETLAREGKVPRDRLPLLGIPLGIKDVLVIDGVRTTCGSKMLENYIPPYTATAVARLEQAGSVTLGKLNMDEFAMGGSNENSAYGPVKHPTHPDRVPGGSSGGSAAAVGANLCVAALGTDTGGSIRTPAAYSGIVGLKPTYGRVSRYGMIAFGSSLDQIGPMTRSVEDAARLLEVMAGHDAMDSTSAGRQKGAYVAAARADVDLKGVRIGVPQEYFVDGVTESVQKLTREALDWYRTQGATLVPLSLPNTSYSVAVYYMVAVSEASSNLARFDGVRFGVRPPGADQADSLEQFYQRVRANFGPEVKRRIILGTFALSAGYSDAYFKRACQVRRLIAQDFAKAFEICDVIAGPVTTETAFKLGEKISNPLRLYLKDIFTIPANLAGLPALSVPCGRDAEGLPVGLHLIGPQFQEERILGLARAYEKGHA